MPITKETIGSVSDLEEGTSGFLGRNDISVGIQVDLSQFTPKEIDADGYLKPYILLKRDGTMVASGGGYGVTAERVKVAADNLQATIDELGDQEIAVFLRANVVRAIAEDVLDRAYTGAELTGFATAGCHCLLIY